MYTIYEEKVENINPVLFAHIKEKIKIGKKKRKDGGRGERGPNKLFGEKRFHKGGGLGYLVKKRNF